MVRGIDDVQTLLDDHIIKTQAVRGSPFVKPIEKEVKDAGSPPPGFSAQAMPAQSILVPSHVASIRSCSGAGRSDRGGHGSLCQPFHSHTYSGAGRADRACVLACYVPLFVLACAIFVWSYVHGELLFIVMSSVVHR